jgi:hypothetical protein
VGLQPGSWGDNEFDMLVASCRSLNERNCWKDQHNVPNCDFNYPHHAWRWADTGILGVGLLFKATRTHTGDRYASIFTFSCLCPELIDFYRPASVLVVCGGDKHDLRDITCKLRADIQLD